MIKKINEAMKKVIVIVRKLIKVLFPKSRIGNVVYLILGYAGAHYADIEELIELIMELFN